MAQKSRKTIGTNPLDAVVPDLLHPRRASSGENGAPALAEVAPSVAAPAQTRTESSRKERLTIHLSSALIERVKNAVFWTPGLTLADLGEKGLALMVDELEAQRGAPFEVRSAELKGGRPLKRP